MSPEIVKEGGDDRGGGLRARQPGKVTVAFEIERKPLIAEGVAAAHFRRVGGDEDRIGEGVAPELAQPDEIAPIRTIAVQQDDGAFGVAGNRRQHGAGEFDGVGHRLSLEGVPIV